RVGEDVERVGRNLPRPVPLQQQGPPAGRDIEVEVGTWAGAAQAHAERNVASDGGLDASRRAVEPNGQVAGRAAAETVEGDVGVPVAGELELNEVEVIWPF